VQVKDMNEARAIDARMTGKNVTAALTTSASPGKTGRAPGRAPRRDSQEVYMIAGLPRLDRWRLRAA
jgi:hypothetical protein